MDVKTYMKKDVVSIPASATIREAAKVFAKRHIGLLPILDESGKPIGAVGLRDLLTLEMPDFVRFVEDLDFVHDFGAVETTRPPAETLNQPITTLMNPVITVDEDSGLLRAYAVMMQHNLHDIPVVAADGRLVGIASRVDIGVAILSTWIKREKKK